VGLRHYSTGTRHSRVVGYACERHKNRVYRLYSPSRGYRSEIAQIANEFPGGYLPVSPSQPRQVSVRLTEEQSHYGRKRGPVQVICHSPNMRHRETYTTRRAWEDCFMLTSKGLRAKLAAWISISGPMLRTGRLRISPSPVRIRAKTEDRYRQIPEHG
jgi:hypothetical protein